MMSTIDADDDDNDVDDDDDADDDDDDDDDDDPSSPFVAPFPPPSLLITRSVVLSVYKIYGFRSSFYVYASVF